MEGVCDTPLQILVDVIDFVMLKLDDFSPVGYKKYVILSFSR